MENYYDDMQRSTNRSSEDRSSKGSKKVLEPRLSVVHAAVDTGRSRIKFDVDDTKKTVPSKIMTSALWAKLSAHEDTMQKASASYKDVTKTSIIGNYSEISTLSLSHGKKTHFVGDMRQNTSSKFSETAPQAYAVEGCASVPNSQFVSLGNASDLSINDVWQWPWLPPSVTSVEFFSKMNVPSTFRLQDSLPALPKFCLEDVLFKFISSIQTIHKPKVVDEVKELVNDLIDHKSKNEEVWIALKKSSSLCPWVKPDDPETLFFSRQEAPLTNTVFLAPFMWDLWPERQDSQIDRAVILIEIVSEFIRLVQSEKLDSFKDEEAYPMCNHQFRKLFASVKIPGMPADAEHSFLRTMRQEHHRKSPQHIIIISRGQMFSLNILQTKQRTIPTNELLFNLRQIIDISDGVAEKGGTMSGHNVGVLSSMDRDIWSETRVELMDLSYNNRACLHRLEEALFVINFDHRNCRGPERICEDALFADGYNRFYDKGLSFYIYKNGLITVNVCSPILDSMVVSTLLRFCHAKILEDFEKWDDEVYRKSGFVSRCESAEFLHLKEPMSNVSNTALSETSDIENEWEPPTLDGDLHPLIFDVCDEIEARIKCAKDSFEKIKSAISTAMCHFTRLDGDFLKDRQINPDAFAQLALQLTFYKMYFRPAAVGSKVNHKRFHHGRYDTLLTSTPESVAWCKSMYNEDATEEIRRQLYYAAVKRHTELMEDARNGKGYYYQMDVLKMRAARYGDENIVEKLDQLQSLPGGSPETMDIYSEGTGHPNCLSVVVIAPLSVKSYGVGYAIAKGKLLFTITSWKDNPGTCAENFAGMLQHCLDDLRRFLV